MALVVIDDDVFAEQSASTKANFGRIVGQIFRLLPLREEDKDWVKPLDTLLVEISGYTWIIPSEKLTALVSKLRGLKSEECQNDFMLFRRMIFEACGIASNIAAEIARGEL